MKRLSSCCSAGTRNSVPKPNSLFPRGSQGGIGLNTAAASVAAGAHGRRARSPTAAHQRIAPPQKCAGLAFRVRWQPNRVSRRAVGRSLSALQTPRQCDGGNLCNTKKPAWKPPNSPAEEKLAQWREAVARQIQNADPNEIVFLGQSACFASQLAERYVTVAGVLASGRRTG